VRVGYNCDALPHRVQSPRPEKFLMLVCDCCPTIFANQMRVACTTLTGRVILRTPLCEAHLIRLPSLDAALGDLHASRDRPKPRHQVWVYCKKAFMRFSLNISPKGEMLS
jgi:hypothetical protein